MVILQCIPIHGDPKWGGRSVFWLLKDALWFFRFLYEWQRAMMLLIQNKWHVWTYRHVFDVFGHSRTVQKIKKLLVGERRFWFCMWLWLTSFLYFFPWIVFYSRNDHSKFRREWWWALQFGGVGRGWHDFHTNWETIGSKISKTLNKRLYQTPIAPNM